MKQKYYVLPQLFIAFLILGVSIYKSSSVKYVFSQAPSSTSTPQIAEINYQLPDPNITPESMLWPAQALLDKLDQTPSAHLENANVRLVAGNNMVAKGKIEEGYLVLKKAQDYLEKSYNLASKLEDNNHKKKLMNELSEASLKHREVLEAHLAQAPDDGRPIVTLILNTPKSIFLSTANELLAMGEAAPKNPFE